MIKKNYKDKKLTDLQMNVTQKDFTEKPFENKYYNFFKQGIYVDIITGEPLFSSKDKFKSGCGWPSFSKPIEDKHIIQKKDESLDMDRIEVRSKKGNFHLGHVFNDGPKDSTGLRYCINSAAINFIKKEDMINEGYQKYLKYV